MKALPKAISGFDGKTVRMRAIDLPVVGKVANTVRQRYVDLSKIQAPPTKWDFARIGLVLMLASMPILAIPVDVFGLVPQSTIISGRHRAAAPCWRRSSCSRRIGST